MVWAVRATLDFDRITPYLCVWHGYDPAVKADLYSTCLVTSEGAYLVLLVCSNAFMTAAWYGHLKYPQLALPVAVAISWLIALPESALQVPATRWGHAEQFSAPVFACKGAFPGATPRQFRRLAGGDEICDGLRVICIEGAAAGEILLHYAPDGGTLIVGDALINFEPYGFTFLPGKYCSNEKEMRRSLRKLLGYKAERMLFAHGTPILSGASERLRALLGHPKTD